MIGFKVACLLGPTWANYLRAFADECGTRLVPDKQPLLDIASLLFALVVGLPQIFTALVPSRPKNLRTLAMLLGTCGLLCGAAAIVHFFGGAPAVRAALLGLSALAGLGWLLLLLSLARHNTTM